MVFERQLEEEQSVVRYNANVQKISSDEQKALLLHCLPNMLFMAARGRVKKDVIGKKLKELQIQIRRRA